MPQSPSVSVSRTDASRPWVPVPFACTPRLDGWSSVCLDLVGELDLATCPAFEQVLKQAQHEKNIVSIDLQELTFLDCAGLTAIVHAAAHAAATGARLILVGAVGQVGRLFDLTGPFQTVEMVTAEAAAASRPLAEGAPS